MTRQKNEEMWVTTEKQSFLKKLLSYLPISRKKHHEDLGKVLTTVQGLTQADEHHSQIETNLMAAVGTLQKNIADKSKKDIDNNSNNKKRRDEAYV